jgi:hypothetical protein
MKLHQLLIAASVFAVSTTTSAIDISLKIPELSANRHAFYEELLESSLKDAGHAVKIEVVKNVPQPRIMYMLENDELPIFWALQTKERDGKFIPVASNLTNGLIGNRILLIPKGDDGKYAAATNVDQFKALNLKGVFGQGWFDTKVWAANGLGFTEQAGELKNLYQMVEAKNRGVDYFARGANEIMEEAKNNPGLMIEPKLVLVYDRDVRFYLAKGSAALKPVIEDALAKADKSGLKKKLIDKYFGPALAGLNLDKRVKISIKTPTDQ